MGIIEERTEQAMRGENIEPKKKMTTFKERTEQIERGENIEPKKKISDIATKIIAKKEGKTSKEVKKKLLKEAGIVEVDEKYIKVDEKGKSTIKITEFVKNILKTNSFKTIFWDTRETIYVFKDGIWLPTGREFIETLTEKALLHYANNNLVREIIGKIKRQTAIDKDKFNELPENIICIDNGLLNLNTKKLSDYSNEYYFKTKIPLYFNPKADCPRIKRFFSEVLYEEDIPLMQEWFGFNLCANYFKKKAVILFGERDSGKTITMNLLTKFIGDKNKSNLSLHKIGVGKGFDLLYLKDKYANILDDLSSKDLSDVGGFKMATGKSGLFGEVKFGGEVGFYSFAKMTFATNKIPPVKDIDDDAYFGRWLTILYDNVTPEEKQDNKLDEKLVTKDELSGLLNWSLEGLGRLNKNNKFSFNKTPLEVKDIMMRSGHPLSAFAQDCLVENTGNKIPKEDMFMVYTNWCVLNNKARLTKDQVGKQLERAVSYILSERTGRGRYWLNVGLCDSSDTFLKNMRNNKKGNNTITDILSHKPSQASHKHTSIPEEDLSQEPQFDRCIIQFLPCSIDSCSETETNLDGMGKPYCQKHWQEFATK